LLSCESLPNTTPELVTTGGNLPTRLEYAAGGVQWQIEIGALRLQQ
jgi:hypothetical protein